jgi:hypothetical protein
VRRTEGSVIKINLGRGKAAFGLVLREPLIAIFDREFSDSDDPDFSTLVEGPIAFQLMVMNYAITDGRWPVVARIPVPEHLRTPPAFCKKDEITGQLSIYQEVENLAPHYERDARPDECRGLETAAVWEPEHIEDRIRDHFAGRPNVWAEQLRICT